MRGLHLVFVIDRTYIQHFLVTASSLLQHNQSIIRRLYLLYDPHCINQRKLHTGIARLLRRYVVEICHCPFDSNCISDLKITHHLSLATYYKLLFACLLPKDVEWVLYLDSDIINCANLNSLVTSALDKNTPLYAVNHRYTQEQLIRLDFIGRRFERYFNAGVLLVNLRMWRERGYTEGLLETARRYHNQILWHDQDVLNIFFMDSWQEMPYKFNAFGLDEHPEWLSDDLTLIHYTGSIKPWHMFCQHPLQQLYWRYRRKAPLELPFYEDMNWYNIKIWLRCYMRPTFLRWVKQTIFCV